MKRKPNVKCPYCEHVFSFILDIANLESNVIMTCDDESGGCGTPFYMQIQVDITLYPLKVEGIEQFSSNDVSLVSNK